jgi:hypothetical protein
VNRPQHDPLRGRETRPLTLDAVLEELDKPNGDRELAFVELVRRGLVRHVPHCLEGVDGKPGRLEESDRLSAPDAPRTLRVGDRKQTIVVGL